jgi:hypothetical protein
MEALVARDISSDIALAKDENERQRTKVDATKKTAVFVGTSANPIEDSHPLRHSQQRFL